MPLNPAKAFCQRAEAYARYRPEYPESVAALLERELRLPPRAVIADIGAGTGISAELFLRRGHTVHAIDPNPEMRAECEKRLGTRPGFHNVNATAEATTLEDASVDMVIAAQAFHWFDAGAARREWQRILRPPGRAALFWNVRLTGSSEFAEAYEALLMEHAPAYRQRHYHQIRTGSDAKAASGSAAGLFGAGNYRTAAFPNQQTLDLDAFEGRLLSSSYAPLPGSTESAQMRHRLRALFERFEQGGAVRIEYTAQVWWGFLLP